MDGMLCLPLRFITSCDDMELWQCQASGACCCRLYIQSSVTSFCSRVYLVQQPKASFRTERHMQLAQRIRQPTYTAPVCPVWKRAGPWANLRWWWASAQVSLRPILHHLAYYQKLKLPLLKGLARLLTLFSNWFNVTLGAYSPMRTRILIARLQLHDICLPTY